MTCRQPDRWCVCSWGHLLTWSRENAVNKVKCSISLAFSHSEQKKKSLDSERQPKNKTLPKWGPPPPTINRCTEHRYLGVKSESSKSPTVFSFSNPLLESRPEGSHSSSWSHHDDRAVLIFREFQSSTFHPQGHINFT